MDRGPGIEAQGDPPHALRDSLILLGVLAPLAGLGAGWPTVGLLLL